MQILLFSDSHGNLENMRNAIDKNENIKTVIHLGDCVSDVLKMQELYCNLTFEYVKGNNDWYFDCEVEKLIEIEGKRIFFTHGHTYGVKNTYQRLIAKGNELKADAILFGHTHQTEENFSEEMLLLNPGCIGSSYLNNGNPTYCLLEITKEKIIVKFKGCN